MKMISKLLMIIGILLSSIIVNGQCLVDLGNDTTICVGLYGITSDSVFIGSGINLTNGTPPYTYSWSCNYTIGGVIPLTASNFLNDTTLSNPQFIDNIGSSDFITFYLTVTDDIGNTCIDSVAVRFSSFGYHLSEFHFYINQGDSVQFYGLPLIGGAVAPLDYFWTPSSGLNDSTDLAAWASPDTTTFYYLSAIDSVGCITDTNVYYKIFINPTGIYDEDNKDKLFNIYPNPNKGNFEVETNVIEDGIIKIYTITGQPLLERKITQNTTLFDLSNYAKGVYLVKMKNGNKTLVQKVIYD